MRRTGRPSVAKDRTSRAVRLLFALSALAAVGCGSKDTGTGSDRAPPPPDALMSRIAAGTVPDPIPPLPPAKAAPPNLLPCPSGWRTVEIGSLFACDPWPEDGRRACADDETHFVGDPGCTRIGSPCPTGDFSDDLPANAPTLYVRSGAPSGGNGSIGAPFAHIQDALLAAPAHAVIALSKGTFDEILVVKSPVTLIGACTLDTRVTTSSPLTHAGVIRVESVGVEIRNVRIGGLRHGIIVATTSASLELDDVIVDHATGAGLVAQGAGKLHGKNILVTATQSDFDLATGAAIAVFDRASIDLSRVVAEDALIFGASCYGDQASLTLSDAAIERVHESPYPPASVSSITVGQGCALDLQRVVVEDGKGPGITVSSTGTRGRVVDTVVRNLSVGSADVTIGIGLSADQSSKLEVSRVWIDGTEVSGLGVQDPGTTADVEDLIVTNTRGAALPKGSSESFFSIGGLNLAMGATFTGRRIATLHNAPSGLSVGGAGTTVEIQDLTASYNESEQTIDFAEGASIFYANATIERARFEGNHNYGIIVAGMGSDVTLRDVEIVGTTRPSSGPFTKDSQLYLVNGLGAGNGAHVSLERAAFDHNLDDAIFAGSGAVIDATDVSITHTLSGPVGFGGRGMEIDFDSTFRGDRFLLEDNGEVAVYIANTASVSLSNIAIGDTRARNCPSTICGDYIAGFGIVATGSAALALQRFTLSGSAFCAIQIAGHASIDLFDGRVRQNPIGVNVQAPGFDLSRLVHNVVYEENQLNLDAGDDIPVPKPSAEMLGAPMP